MNPFDRRLSVALTAYAAALVVVCVVTYQSFAPGRGRPPEPPAARWSIAALERFRRDEPLSEVPSEARTDRASAPIVILAFDLGRPIARSTGERTLAAAVARAIREFSTNPLLAHGTEFRDSRVAGTRFSITYPLGDARTTVAIPGFRSFAYVPTRDALVARLGDREEALVPDEMVADGLVAGAIPTGLTELDVGVPIDRALDVLAERFGIPRDALVRDARFFHRRVRTLSADAYPVRVEPTLGEARRGMREAAAYLLRQLGPEGFFEYQVDARTGDTVQGPYLLARHAGAAYFLAQVARIDDDPALRRAATIALQAIVRRDGRSCGPPSTLCFDEAGTIDGGTAALALIAYSELELAGPDEANREVIRRIGEFLLSLQRPDGELMHLYDAEADRPVDVQLPYFSGEIALAFLRADEVLGDARYARAAERALRYLGARSWDFPASRYVHAEEHWTCIASGEARGRFDAHEVQDFCRSVFAWNDWAQLAPGDSPFPVEGNYGLGPIFAPRYPALGTRLESFVEVYRTERFEGRQATHVRAHLERGIRAARGLLLLPGPSRHVAYPHVVRGGIGGSYTDPIIRIDHVQHVGSALARYVELLEAERMANPSHGPLVTPRTHRR